MSAQACRSSDLSHALGRLPCSEEYTPHFPLAKQMIWWEIRTTLYRMRCDWQLPAEVTGCLPSAKLYPVSIRKNYVGNQRQRDHLHAIMMLISPTGCPAPHAVKAGLRCTWQPAQNSLLLDCRAMQAICAEAWGDDSTSAAKALGIMSLGWTMGSTLGPAFGGALSEPCTAIGAGFPLCGQGGLFQARWVQELSSNWALCRLHGGPMHARVAYSEG